ncbi:MAG TPA: glucose-1-phosphate adenylyltransferase [Steroidobacteraceae bacterium]
MRSDLHAVRSLSSRASAAPSPAPAAATLALVLAGGNGTRLGALTRWECKPALPFGGKFRNIDFSLSNCVHSGVRRVGVLTQYKSQSLIRHLEQAWSFLPRNLGEFVELWPAQQRLQPDWYSGTANAVHQNIDMIRAQNPRYILVLAGDHVYRMDYRRLLAHHVRCGAETTIACVRIARQDAEQFGVLRAGAADRAVDFMEKPHPAQLHAHGEHVLASMGVYVFNADYLYERLERDAANGASSHDFGRDILPGAVGQGTVGIFEFTDAATGAPAFWRDVGTLDSYWKTHMELLDAKIQSALFDPGWPIFTDNRQLPPARIMTADGSGRISDSLLSDGCVLRAAEVVSSVLGPCVDIGRGSSVVQSVLLPDSRIGVRCRLRRVIVEAGCDIPDDTVIGENPAEDAARFEMSPGGVVLVTKDRLSEKEKPLALARTHA